MTTRNPPPARNARSKSVGMFVVTAMTLVAAGGWYYRAESQRVIHEKHEALESISQLKAGELQAWRRERQVDVRHLVEVPFFEEALESFLNDPENEKDRAVMQGYLKLERGNGESVVLYAPDGRFLLGVGDDACAEPHLATAPLQRAITAAVDNPVVVVSDLYRCPHGDVHLDVLTAVRDEAGQPLAVVALRSDAAVYLYRLIESWPTPSRTAETLLVQRDGDEVVYLNHLRHQPGKAMALRIPLTNRKQPGVRAVLGEVGIFEGLDYRGVAVVSDLQAVPDSPWFLVTKVDAEEIFSEVRYRTVLISIITGLLILLSAGLVTVLHRRRQAGITQQLVESEVRNVEGRHRYERILQTAMDGFWVADRQGHIVEVNAAYSRMVGYSTDELLGMRVGELEAAESQAQTAAHLQTAVEQGENRFESRQRCQDGSILDAEISVQYFPADRLSVAFVRDISARKKAETRIRRLTMLYAALSRCDKAMVHSVDAGELLSEVCRDVVEQGGMEMAWISIANPVNGRVFPSVFHGRGTEYLEGIEISVDASTPSGRGPTGTAIREGRPVFCQDFLNDPSTAPWHERAAAAGWNASAAIPLRRGGRSIGAFTLYSAERHAFDEEVRNLLIEMADNISFALDNFAREKERRKALDELQNLRTAVEQSADTIVITDPAGNIEYANPAFETSSGYSIAEALGKNPRVLKSGELDPEHYQELWKAISSGQTWKGQFRNRRKDGTLYWESATISPVLNDRGEIAHFIAVKDDITEMKAIEQKLREALDQAEAANRTKGEFLAVMSHELRTPLNGVLGFADLLCQTPLNQEQLDYAQTIRGSGDHLLQIVNDILDFSSIEKGSMPLEIAAFAVADLVEKSCLASRKTAADKGLEFRSVMAPGVPLQLLGDARRMRQILINLVGNAVKFTSRGAVTLRVTAVAVDQRAFLEFAVEDTGPGIRTELMEHLFKPFTQGDSTLRRQFEGTGLGLAISQRLAMAMDGGITVSSIPDKGSTFTLRVPLVSPLAGANERDDSQPAKRLEPDGNRMAPSLPVLVVEDDPVNRLLVGIMLKNLGYQVEHAADGRQALEVFHPGRFFAVLMDMQMPELDGLQATRGIRERELGTDFRVPVIALTANVMIGERERCLAAGMDDFMTKPFKKSDLELKLARFPLHPPLPAAESPTGP